MGRKGRRGGGRHTRARPKGKGERGRRRRREKKVWDFSQSRKEEWKRSKKSHRRGCCILGIICSGTFSACCFCGVSVAYLLSDTNLPVITVTVFFPSPTTKSMGVAATSEKKRTLLDTTNALSWNCPSFLSTDFLALYRDDHLFSFFFWGKTVCVDIVFSKTFFSLLKDVS